MAAGVADPDVGRIEPPESVSKSSKADEHDFYEDDMRFVVENRKYGTRLMTVTVTALFVMLGATGLTFVPFHLESNTLAALSASVFGLHFVLFYRKILGSIGPRK